MLSVGHRQPRTIWKERADSLLSQYLPIQVKRVYRMASIVIYLSITLALGLLFSRLDKGSSIARAFFLAATIAFVIVGVLSSLVSAYLFHRYVPVDVKKAYNKWQVRDTFAAFKIAGIAVAIAIGVSLALAWFLARYQQ